MREITSGEVKQRLCSKAEHALVDVRREGDFAKGHLFFASNAPRSLLELKIEGLVPKRQTAITLCAENEDAARDAAGVLALFGYEDVANLAGGLEGWTQSGGRVFSGLNVPSKAFGEFVEKTANTPHISPQALKDLIDRRENLVIFDARPFAEYQTMSIPGSIDCPGGELVFRAAAHLPSAEAVVVVNCAGRTRSIIGAQSLIDTGFPNPIFALRDGTMGWHLAGYDLEHAQTRRAPPPAGVSSSREAARRLARKAGVNFIEVADIDAMRAGDRTVYVFDVRDPAEYKQGHWTDAVSAPGGQLLQTLDTFVAVHNASIVVTDRDGVRAPVIASWLRQMGHENVSCAVDPRNESRAEVPASPSADAIIAGAPKVSAEAAFATSDALQCVVVDLANSKDYRREHIRRAIFRERHQLPELLLERGSDRPVILTAPDGRAAAVAAAELALAGHRIAALEGGTAAWKRAGHPLENGQGALPEKPDDVFYRPYDLAENREEAMQAYLDWEKGLLDRLEEEPGVAFWRVR